jgi:hypothetical protein
VPAKDKVSTGPPGAETWEESKVGGEAEPEEILAVDGALTRPRPRESRTGEGREARYYVGLTIPEIAAALEVFPARSIGNGLARAWLYRQITEDRRTAGVQVLRRPGFRLRDARLSSPAVRLISSAGGSCPGPVAELKSAPA